MPVQKTESSLPVPISQFAPLEEFIREIGTRSLKWTREELLKLLKLLKPLP